MSTFSEKIFGAFFATIFVCITVFGLMVLHYTHVERMVDKQIELVKLQNICIDD